MQGRMKMGVLDRLNLIEEIAKQTFAQLEPDMRDRFIDAYKIPIVPIPGGAMESVKYLALRMENTKMSVLKKIAEELKIDISHLPAPSTKSKKTPIKKEIDSSPMIGFISYEHTDVDYANRLNKILAKYNIAAFVAYRNTREGEPFQPDIIAALNKMTFFISIHTEAFSASAYCQQEVGFALARGVKMIQIKLGKDPDGFIKGITAIVQNAQNLDIITPRILKILAESPKTKDLYSAKVADKVAKKLTEKHAIPDYLYKERKAIYRDLKTPSQTGMDLGKRPDELM